jgi:hypothetical protein
VNDAHVWSTLGGETKKVDGGWEIAIGPGASNEQARQLTIRAEVADKGWAGHRDLTLADEHSLTTSVELAKDGELPVRGIVVDSHGNSIANALVSVVGYGKDATLSDASGNFVLPSHAVSGEIVQLHAEKPPFLPADDPGFKVGSGTERLTLKKVSASSDAPGKNSPPGKRPSNSNSSAGSSSESSQNNSDTSQCESFLEFQGDESGLATLGEQAFSKQIVCMYDHLPGTGQESSSVGCMGEELSFAGSLLFTCEKGQDSVQEHPAGDVSRDAAPRGVSSSWTADRNGADQPEQYSFLSG